MSTVALSSLRSRCREMSDMVDSDFVSDTELLSYINSSYAELYDILVGKFEDYHVTSSTFTISSGNSNALPTDFYKLRGLDFQLDSNSWISLKKFNFNKRNLLNRSVVYNTGLANEVQYRILGNTIYLEPEDNALGNYKIWYIPTYTALVSESDTVDGVNGWEEYIVVDTAIKMLAKEESSITHLTAQKNNLLKRIETMSQNRDYDQPEQITDSDESDAQRLNRIF